MTAELTIDEAKRVFQRHLTSGIVLVIGSGLSCAEGLPSMNTLSEALAATNPQAYGAAVSPETWVEIVDLISKNGLEPALKELDVSNDVADLIRLIIAREVLSRETVVAREVLARERTLRLSTLFPHLPSSDRFTVITTNYDRLVELAAESSGFLVDSRTRGFHYGQFSKTDGPYAYAKTVTTIRGIVRKTEERCISLYKPHGSLDWADCAGVPIRTSFPIDDSKRLIVTPGKDKYRAGYNQPFDLHRELANDAIDRASRLLIIGYGFNDDHLETHLNARIRSGVQTLILSRSLTPNAKEYLNFGATVWGLEAGPTGNGTIIHNGNQSIVAPDIELWDVAGFVREVLL